MNKILCLVALLVVLSACGGGGGREIGPPAAPALPTYSTSLSGTMNVLSVTVLTPSPNTLQSMDLQVDATFTGSVSPGAVSFDVPVSVLSVSRGGAVMSGSVTFNLASGTAGAGSWVGRGVVTLPPQPVGDHVFSAALSPQSVFNFTGSSSSAVTGTVRVVPPNPP